MIKVEEALKVVLKTIKRLSAEEIKFTEALDRVAAEDIYAVRDIPQLDNSAMDGYALKAADTVGASKKHPLALKVVEALKAGDISKKVLIRYQAIRIMTGAPVPRGADTVVKVEDTQREGGDRVRIFQEASLGENIRKAGEDIKKGQLVIPQGTLLNSAHIGLLASLGKAKIKVTKKPKVAVLATGDELVDVGEELVPGKLYSSNTYTLYSQILKCAGIPKNLGIAKDKPAQLEKKIKQGLDCDLVLTSGGVSVGDYDLVKDILAKMGTNIKFWKVAMRPGKPLVFGAISTKCGKGIPIFGLPGNPVSSMISFEIFVRPVMLKMLGQKIDKTRDVEAVLEEDIAKKSGLKYFLRAQTRWEGGIYCTRTTGPQGSGVLKSMALANSLIILPEDKDFIKRGTRVRVRLLE